jgi:hypothetical protein
MIWTRGIIGTENMMRWFRKEQTPAGMEKERKRSQGTGEVPVITESGWPKTNKQQSERSGHTTTMEKSRGESATLPE